MIHVRTLLSFGLPAGLLALCVAASPAVQDSKPAAKGAPGAKAAPAGDDASGEYGVDLVHSTVIFRIKHANVSYSYGRFNELSGRFTLDTAQPEKSSIEITVQAASVDTANKKRDQHLQSPDFFNAAEFPEINFTSDKVKAGKDGKLEVSGQLFLHGVTKPITVEVERVGAGPGLGDGGPAAGFETTFTINRSDFGMDYGAGALGDDVRLTVSIEGQKQG